MKPKPSERGQALILIVFAAIALFAFTALAIDGSRVFSDRRHAQNSADTAALAAALAKVRGQDYANAAIKRAESNGFTTTNSTVEVHLCNEASLNPPCEGLPQGADPTQYIQIVIRMNTPTTFARILGWQQVPTVVSAIARAVGGASPVSFQSAAVSAMSPNDPSAIHGLGNFDLEINNSGIFDNSLATGCPSGGALWFNGTGTYTVDPNYGYEVVGDSCLSGNPKVDQSLFKKVNQIPYPPAIDIPVPTISCSPDPVYPRWEAGGWLVPPGNHPNVNLPGGSVTFASGDHCFQTGFSITGYSNVTVLENTNFLITGGEFHIATAGTFTCVNNLLVHVNGGTGVRLNGSSTNTCTGVTFYMSTGNVSWLGDVTNIYSAPTSGTYRGLLIYMPYGNTQPLKISGNSSSEFTGSIIAVSSPITLQGNGDTLALSTKIIGYTVGFGGNGKFQIDYNPSQQYAQGEPTMIQLTK